MSVRCRDIMSIIEKKAPVHLAAQYDNVGLLIGDENSIISTILIALDINDDVIEEAIEKGSNLIVTHHPIIFSPIKSINAGHFKGRMIYKLISNKINVYAAHTNLDAADSGINDFLAHKLGMTNVQPLNKVYEDKLYKLTVYVPEEYADKVRTAVTGTGAGCIGNYSSCTFNISGSGTFMPLEGTSPFIGKVGLLERVEETRIETIVDSSRLHFTIEKMLAAHPYEEVAYDIYPLENKGKEYGFGRIGNLKAPLRLEEFCFRIKDVLGIDSINVVGDPDSMVNKVAVCSGSGADLVSTAYKAGCDAYITGDIKYHDACDARDMGISLIDAGHFATENIYMPQLLSFINENLAAYNHQTEVFLSKTNKCPYFKV